MTNSVVKLDQGTLRIHPNEESTSGKPGASQSQPLRQDAGRVLCLGGDVAGEVQGQLDNAQYEAAHLPFSSDIEALICKASDFGPDLTYLALDTDLQTGLDVLEAFSKDARTKSTPLLCLLPPDANSSVIQEAFSRTACDFFRLDHTRVELLSRTHMLVRLAKSGQASQGAGAPLSSYAANQPAAGRVDLRDQATNLFSASYFFHRLPTEVSRARRYKRALSLMALRCEDAVDNDQIAERLSKTLQKHLRDSDIPARLEPGLFVCLLPELTGDKLEALEQRLDRDFERASLSIRIGRASLEGDAADCSPQDLVERARAGSQD